MQIQLIFMPKHAFFRDLFAIFMLDDRWGRDFFLPLVLILNFLKKKKNFEKPLQATFPPPQKKKHNLNLVFSDKRHAL